MLFSLRPGNALCVRAARGVLGQPYIGRQSTRPVREWTRVIRVKKSDQYNFQSTSTPVVT